MNKRIVAYLTQYGYWWSCTTEQWNRLVVEGKKGKGHNLEEHFATSLKSRPSVVRTRVDRDTGRRSCWAPVPVFQCLDFDATDWEFADKEVQATNSYK